ncbi:hypothetical protein RV11_GL000473 [Enterococcus phoeniculicola]|jgi:hypothetical protein|uniref:Uncharacterized protein n=1 Tax=Enterococcus phoeniculicola ATCC BAA-412 TaxID=1158610 RepID=R3TX53_9ENTE|nr:hypothetical protein [Enterococcus phoeniculicola]EOL46189.1 hypothetical protein UC3_00995 [Enterococcus phoeniculicola ATCC BAA-412]EOT76966.1 hypothetical protein I589_01927 [Enterococcus phoeniculicola ATCC BAA-412]OJG71183.1 hypothetical protein RV11_GL000473 [Enterococcus phoeniculicola]
MKLFLTRQTGFYAIASPIDVWINGEKRMSIQNQQTKEIELPDDSDSVTVQVRFSFLLRSPVYSIPPSPMKSYTVVMNPQLIQIYLALFASMIIFPLVLKSLWLTLIILILFGFFLKNMASKAYLLKENIHGETV